jgi:hypothetical protein
LFWQMREIPATIAAIWDSYIAPIREGNINNFQI